ncbi:hypothetical protein [Rhizorhapis sp. SPR117]|uniref:hypothetical protein n=1 Tax=Rhizorhapis sp. SPR117 TaxID=2912611 RepID=UPI001F31A2A0|nr:hypothetical protein [Rhizorhapis sp. SPR117]
MENLWTVLATALVTLIGAYFAYWLTGKPRLIAFSPNSAWFELKQQNDNPPFTLKAGQLIVQNQGRKSANRVQLTAQPGPHPWGYSIFPSVDHEIRTGARDEWILEMPYLGPGEIVTVQVLNGPLIDTVRSLEGPAKMVPVIHQRLLPKWFNLAALTLLIIGLITAIYGLYSVARFLIQIATMAAD